LHTKRVHWLSLKVQVTVGFTLGKRNENYLGGS
jgi:hypothetical protein